MVLGMCLTSDGQHDRGLHELQAALRVNPNFALARALYGWVLSWTGRFDDAVVETQTALSLSPADTFLSLYEFCHGSALLAASRFDEALPYIRNAIVSFPGFPGHYALLISCCGHLGLREEARMLLARRNSLAGPPLTVSLVRNQLHGFEQGPIFVEGLIKAGVPET
jgi:adenylate cyclase